MIRGTHNESIKTVSRSVVSESFETVLGSPDGVAPDELIELREIDVPGLNPANTYSIVPSNDHTGNL